MRLGLGLCLFEGAPHDGHRSLESARRSCGSRVRGRGARERSTRCTHAAIRGRVRRRGRCHQQPRRDPVGARHRRPPILSLVRSTDPGPRVRGVLRAAVPGAGAHGRQPHAVLDRARIAGGARRGHGGARPRQRVLPGAAASRRHARGRAQGPLPQHLLRPRCGTRRPYVGTRSCRRAPCVECQPGQRSRSPDRAARHRGDPARRAVRRRDGRRLQRADRGSGPDRPTRGRRQPGTRDGDRERDDEWSDGRGPSDPPRQPPWCRSVASSRSC